MMLLFNAQVTVMKVEVTTYESLGYAVVRVLSKDTS